MARPALILLAAALAAPLVAQAPRDLSGRWVLQEDGDTVATPVAVPDSSARSPAPPALPDRRLTDRERLGLVLGMAGAVRAFRWAQFADSVVVTNEDGFRYVLWPGGGERRLTMLDTLAVTYQARWDGSFLEVEWRPASGGKLTERYQLADSGVYLRLDVAVEYQRFRRRESRLYRRVADAP